MKKRASFMIIISICCSILAGGCGKKMTTEDAPVYIQAVLDSRYRSDYNAYMEYRKCTEEEAAQLHEHGLNSVLSLIKIADTSVSSELKDQYRELFAGLHNICKYTVGAAEEDGDGFTVDVTVQPFSMFDGIDQSLIDVLHTEDAMEMTTDEQLYQLIYEEMYNLISPRLSVPEYGSPETVILHIQPDENKVQTVSDEDLNALDAMIYASLL